MLSNKRIQNLNGLLQQKVASDWCYLPVMGHFQLCSLWFLFRSQTNAVVSVWSIDKCLRKGKQSIVNHIWFLELLSNNVSQIISQNSHTTKDEIVGWKSTIVAREKAPNICEHTDDSTCLLLLWSSLREAPDNAIRQEKYIRSTNYHCKQIITFLENWNDSTEKVLELLRNFVKMARKVHRN